MRWPGRSPVRRHALRTAGLATALVAVCLGAVLTATDLLVSRSLTAAVDQRLQDWLRDASAATAPPATEPAPDNDFDEPLLSWTRLTDGSCRPNGSAPSLPPALCATEPATTAEIAGIPFRLMGGPVASGARLVVGASLAPTSGQIDDLILTEVVVGPLLLLLVFVGALVVGSRVGGPVESMRQRQLAFTADASHELRTPLSVMQAEAAVALAGRDEDLRAALGNVSGEIGRMRRIVDDLLWLARFDSEPAAPEPELLDLATAARVAAERFGTIAATRSLALRVEVPDTFLPVSMPAGWLDRLIGVLLDNACRHARSRVTVEARATDDRRMLLSIANDGEGIPPRELARIFDRFHRATSQGEGAGLGLAIADAVVRETQGRWEVTDLAGGGVRFGVSWSQARRGGQRQA